MNSDDTTSPGTEPNASAELDDMVRSIHAIGERGAGRDPDGDSPDDRAGDTEPGRSAAPDADLDGVDR